MSFLFSSRDKSKSQQNNTEEKRPFLEPDSIALLPVGAGQLQHLVRLPPQADIHEWLATNSLAFFTNVNTQVGVISQLCTQATCPLMSAGHQIFELETDRRKKSAKMHARQFIDTVMTQIQKQLRDERIFPTKFGYEFPFDFVQIVRKIFRHYFMILAHIYFHHFHDFRRLQLHDGLNTLFLHFVYFVEEFSLVDHKDISLLEDLTERLKKLEVVMARANAKEEAAESETAVKSRS